MVNIWQTEILVVWLDLGLIVLCGRIGHEHDGSSFIIWKEKKTVVEWMICLRLRKKQRKVSDVDLGVCRCTGVEFGGQWSDLSAAHLLRAIPPKWLFKLAHLGIKAIMAMCVTFLISRYLFVFFFLVFVYPIDPKNIDRDKASHVTICVSQIHELYVDCFDIRGSCQQWWARHNENLTKLISGGW